MNEDLSGQGCYFSYGLFDLRQGKFAFKTLFWRMESLIPKLQVELFRCFCGEFWCLQKARLMGQRA
jgi:hypothetical protein